jgi:hypothetical protein
MTKMSAENQIITNAAEEELPLHVRTMLLYILEQSKAHRTERHHFELDAASSEDGQRIQRVVHTFTIPAHQKEHRKGEVVSVWNRAKKSWARVARSAYQSCDCFAC